MKFKLPANKTKIVCTIGYASNSEAMLEKLMRAGMNVARINFSHGTLDGHRRTIEKVRRISQRIGKVVAILADLPGPKIRIGKLAKDPITLSKGDELTLTTKDRLGDQHTISCTYRDLPKHVTKGSLIFLNDGFIQLKVTKVEKNNVHTKVMVGGFLHSHKGLNIPSTQLAAKGVTRKDLDFISFALKEGVDALSVSFVKNAADLRKVRGIAKKRGKSIFLVAKIERQVAVENCEEILREADGVMVARGDLGVQIPLEEVPRIQKQLIRRANLLGKPVITATQMLESMVENVRPTRAEASDVANAIIDGTDAIMLSAETATGKYPVEAVRTMAKIAAATEQRDRTYNPGLAVREHWIEKFADDGGGIKDNILVQVPDLVEHLNLRYVVTPTDSGDTARRISRFKPHCWTLAFTENRHTFNRLAFSSGVFQSLARWLMATGIQPS